MCSSNSVTVGGATVARVVDWVVVIADVATVVRAAVVVAAAVVAASVAAAAVVAAAVVAGAAVVVAAGAGDPHETSIARASITQLKTNTLFLFIILYYPLVFYIEPCPNPCNQA